MLQLCYIILLYAKLHYYIKGTHFAHLDLLKRVRNVRRNVRRASKRNLYKHAFHTYYTEKEVFLGVRGAVELRFQRAVHTYHTRCQLLNA